MVNALALPPQDHLKECFDYDPTEGTLRWKMRPRQHFRTQRIWRSWCARYGGMLISGTSSSGGYIQVGLDSARYLAARIIFKIMTGEEPPEVDHKDRNRMNNKWGNLRAASVLENRQNKGNQHNASGFRGVRKKKGRFEARIRIRGGLIYLGSFGTAEEAHAKYLTAAHQYFGEFCPAHAE